MRWRRRGSARGLELSCALGPKDKGIPASFCFRGHGEKREAHAAPWLVAGDSGGGHELPLRQVDANLHEVSVLREVLQRDEQPVTCHVERAAAAGALFVGDVDDELAAEAVAPAILGGPQVHGVAAMHAPRPARKPHRQAAVAVFLRCRAWHKRTMPWSTSPRSSSLSLLFLLFGAGVAAGGCDLGPVGLGGDETDDFLIADAAATAHLGKALQEGDSLSFRALFERGAGLVFRQKPNPSALLTATNVLDDERSRAGKRPLSMMTYNVALLDVNIFGVIPYAETPDLAARRSIIPQLIFERGIDVVLLQEVWLDEDVEEFSRVAEMHGYRSFLHDRNDHNDGLMTFLRGAIVLPASQPEFSYAAYGSQSSTEYFPGPGIKRGWNAVRFLHRELGPIMVFNTHMQAFAENWLGRAKQARELGIAIRQAVDSDDTRADLVFAGGDFNASLYYKDSLWKMPDDSKQEIWFHNAISYPVLLAYGDLVDLAIMGRPAEDALADIVLGDTVVNEPSKALDTPGAEKDWCERTPHTTFTATDCNSLYFAQYAGTEYPARLDHLFARDPDERIVVTASTLTFTEQELFDDIEVEPSDHYAVVVDMLVSPR